MNGDGKTRQVPWQPLVAELLGTALLVLVGLTVVILMFGATLPGEGYTAAEVLMGEAITTFLLIAGLCIFLGFRPLRPYTPALFPFLYAVMVYVESPVSGTSTNSARSLGPAIISGQWDGFCIYWAGPLIGVLAGIAVFSFLARRIEVAKLYHFESDRRRLFHTFTSEHR
jgi:aquaporin Z